MIERVWLFSVVFSVIFSIIFCLSFSLIKLRYYRYRDKLTGLYNLDGLYLKYFQLIQKKELKNFVLVSLDVNNFKGINTLFGTNIGDIVLCNIANILLQNTYIDERVSRITGDNFLFLLHNDIHLIERLNNIVEKITKEIKIQDKKVVVSLGVYILKDTDYDFIKSNTNAQLAKQGAKRITDKKINFFDEDILNVLYEEQILLNDFDKGLKNHEFVLYYQIKYDILKNVPVGAEALVRWNHETLGFLSPIKFINLFESKKIISKLDIYVVEEACKALKDLLVENDLKNFRIAINISGVGFMNTEVMTEINRIVDKYEINHSLIEFELTESFFIEEEKQKYVKEIIDNLRKKGYYIAMDDFGTGYATLDMLNKVSVDTLKIDKSFIAEESTKSDEIVKSIILMADKLGIDTVAEGVETEEQSKSLKEKGCKVGQGYYYSKPLSYNKFKEEYFLMKKQ